MTLTVCVSDVVTANDASEVLDVSSIEAMSRDAGALRPVLAPGEDGGGSETRPLLYRFRHFHCYY